MVDGAGPPDEPDPSGPSGPSDPDDRSDPSDRSGQPDDPSPSDPSDPSDVADDDAPTPTRDGGTRSVLEYLRDGWRQAIGSLTALAVVPLVTALLSVGNVLRVVGAEVDFHAGIQFGLPAPIVDVWAFVSLPNPAIDLVGPSSGLVAPFGVAAVAVVVQGVLAAGYLGSVREGLATGSYGFLANVRRYLVPILAYTAIPGLLGVALLAASSGAITATEVGDTLAPVVVLLAVIALPVGYLVFATPYLVVLRDCGLVEALRASVGHALSSGAYVRYAIGYALVVGGLSVPTTLLVVNARLVGVLVGTVAAAPIGLAATVATTRFLADLDDAAADVGLAGGAARPVGGVGGNSTGGSSADGSDPGGDGVGASRGSGPEER